jgi:hypothetical protein
MAPHSLPTGRRRAANAGPYPLQQHGHHCYEVGYAHIRERVANGGPPWTPREPLPPGVAAVSLRREVSQCLCHCGKPVEFGYRNKSGDLDWFCADHRLAEWWADARAVDSTGHPVIEEKQTSEIPDLQKLVAQYGRCDLIPAEAWAEFDGQNHEFQEGRRAQLRRELDHFRRNQRRSSDGGAPP